MSKRPQKILKPCKQKEKVKSEVAKFLKYGKTNKPLPHYILVTDKNKGFIFETATYEKYYSSTKYDWDRAASSPCPESVEGLEKDNFTFQIHIYDFFNEEDEKNFISAYNQRNNRQLKLFESDKKSINKYNYLKKLFGRYVESIKKASQYFLSDIEIAKSVQTGNEIAFRLNNIKIFRLDFTLGNLYRRNNILAGEM